MNDEWTMWMNAMNVLRSLSRDRVFVDVSWLEQDGGAGR
jgi:hypothetical protein